MKIKLYILFVSTFLFFTDVKSDEIFTLGKDIFLNSGNCATCHSLKDASVTNVGPNLKDKT